MKTKTMKQFLGESPMVDFNLKAARLHKFFDQYEAIHQKHKEAMDQISKEYEQMKREKKDQGFKGDEWMGDE